MTALPSPPPDNPLPLVARWLNDAMAGQVQPNPNAMTLATATPAGQPSARVVLIKDFNPVAGVLVFYSHYASRKGRELDANPLAAAVVHWDTLGRQLRFEGRVTRSPHAESDAYFQGRPWLSQLNAWASDQSEPIADPRALAGPGQATGSQPGPPRRRGTQAPVRRRGAPQTRALGRLPADPQRSRVLGAWRRPLS